MRDVLSKNARDLLIIAVRVAGFDRAELQRRIIQHPINRQINAHTVCRWLQEIRSTYTTSEVTHA